MVLPDLPERPTLRPGVHVARRDDTYLQVGVDPPARVVAPDTAGVRRLLAALRASEQPADLPTEAIACLIDLLEADLVVPAGRSAVLSAQFGSTAGPRLGAREAATVGVRGPDPLAGRARQALAGEAVAAATDPEPPTVWLVLSEGEPLRGMLDDLVREGAPHLVVASRSGRLEIGPLVVAGHTACLRCVDAHRAETDPRRHLIVEQAARAAASGAVEPRDELLWSMALAWAVRDILRFVEGDRPSTWSTSHELGPVDAPVSRTWTRHPHCGCAWDQVVG